MDTLNIENLYSFSKLTQSRLVPIQMHVQIKLDWVSFWKQKQKQTKKNTFVFKVAFVCGGGWGQVGGDGGVWAWVCGCVNEVRIEFTGCGELGVGGCVFGCGWVSFGQHWTSGDIVCILILVKAWVFGQKVDWVSLENTLQFMYMV